MNAGRLRHRFILEERVERPDGFGGQFVEFAAQGAVWGAMDVVRDEDAVVGWQRDETVTHRITVRHRARLASGWRLRRGSRVFDVRTVHDPDERRRYLVLRTRERSA